MLATRSTPMWPRPFGQLSMSWADEQLRVAVLIGVGGRVFSAGAGLKDVSRSILDKLIRKDGGFAGFVHAKRRKSWIAADCLSEAAIRMAERRDKRMTLRGRMPSPVPILQPSLRSGP